MADEPAAATTTEATEKPWPAGAGHPGASKVTVTAPEADVAAQAKVEMNDPKVVSEEVRVQGIKDSIVQHLQNAEPDFVNATKDMAPKPKEPEFPKYLPDEPAADAPPATTP